MKISEYKSSFISPRLKLIGIAVRQTRPTCRVDPSPRLRKCESQTAKAQSFLLSRQNCTLKTTSSPPPNSPPFVLSPSRPISWRIDISIIRPSLFTVSSCSAPSFPVLHRGLRSAPAPRLCLQPSSLPQCSGSEAQNVATPLKPVSLYSRIFLGMVRLFPILAGVRLLISGLPVNRRPRPRYHWWWCRRLRCCHQGWPRGSEGIFSCIFAPLLTCRAVAIATLNFC